MASPGQRTPRRRPAPATNGNGTAPQVRERASSASIGKMLQRISSFGGGHDGEVSRLAFSEDEGRAHEGVAGWMAEIGLAVRRDSVGNTIGELPGSVPGLPAIGTGSHLDSVPHGGRFDGVVGVLGAVELVRVLHKAGVRLRHPLRVVAFVAEEGARFGEPCIGSKAVAGVLTNSDLDRLKDRHGVSLREALLEAGADPNRLEDARWDARDWAAFIELHIEQGALLDAAGVAIGIVDLVSGSTRFMITLRGQAGHSGATPMHDRADALAAGAEAIVAAERLVTDSRHHGARMTIGLLELRPNSITTIPGWVRFSVDVRDVDHERQRATAVAISRIVAAVCARRGVEVEVAPLADTRPSVLPMWIREIIVAACRERGVDYRALGSGASHDSQIINAMIPAGMIFVPSKGGMSHVPAEWTSVTDIARGVDTMLDTIVRLDADLDA